MREGAGTTHMEVVMGKKVKLPKRIWGVKIPKQIRKGPLGQFWGPSGGQVVVVEAILAAAAFYAARRIDPDSSVGETLRRPLDGLRAGRAWSRGASDRFARALRAGAHSFRAAYQDEGRGAAAAAAEQTLDEGAGDASDTSLETSTSRPKKSGSSRREARREESSGPH
jgi:hypothetical protein